jgi:hypothetical protein
LARARLASLSKLGTGLPGPKNKRLNFAINCLKNSNPENEKRFLKKICKLAGTF